MDLFIFFKHPVAKAINPPTFDGFQILEIWHAREWLLFRNLVSQIFR